MFLSYFQGVQITQGLDSKNSTQ